MKPNDQTDLKESVQPQSSAEWRADKRVLMILGCLGVVCVMVAIDATILVPSLPAIARALDGTTSEAFWTGTSYLLTNATFQPLIASLSDVFGRREILFLSVALFTIGSLICCLAQDFPTLLTGRTVKGIGGGGIITLNLVVITDIIPLRQRPKYYSFSQIAWALGTISGPLIGGAIAESATWRLLFYINFPFCAVGLITIPWIVRIGSREKSTLMQKLGKIDWTGSLLFIAGTTAFLIAISWAGHQYPWSSYQTLVPLIIGVVTICLSVFWELKYAKSPFMRRNLFRSRPLMTTYVCTLLAGLLIYAQLYYIALFLLSVQARSPIMTGVDVLPIFCGLMPASGLVGIAVSRLGSWKWSIWLGWMVSTLAAGLLVLLDGETAIVSWVFMFLILGLGHGILISAHSFAVQAIAEVEDVAYASALFTFIRSVGLSLGVAIGGTIFQSRLATGLADRGLPGSIADDAEAFIYELVSMPEESPQRAQIVLAYAESFQFLFKILAGISGAALLIGFTITGNHSLDKDTDSHSQHTEKTLASKPETPVREASEV
ncbi:hypothetical protein AAE478_009198 [Parahypoxylon ruwenzoriense]